MTRRLRILAVLPMLALVVPARAPASLAGSYVYWDQSERQDMLVDPSMHVSSMVPTWDPNGQMCLFPKGSARYGQFVVGYNPTLPDQGFGTFPRKDPPVGEAVWRFNGTFSGKTIFVPGPYKNPGVSASTPGGDIPPDPGVAHEFNVNGTFTGCTFDKQANLLAADIGQAQGGFPVPDNGRLIEWFAATDYTTYCILLGPMSGGDAAGGHHVDGTGGLHQPSMMATGPDGDVYLPETGAGDPITGLVPAGHVLRIDHTSLPKTAADCPGPSNMPSTPIKTGIWLQGTPVFMPFPSSIARDPSCSCWAVANIIGFPAVAWFNDDGTPHIGKGPLPTGNYNPFGIAFTPVGDLYFIDIHVQCGAPGPEQVQSGSPLNCGPTTLGGALYKVSFNLNALPRIPRAIATGLDYPTSVTVCVPSERICPHP